MGGLVRTRVGQAGWAAEHALTARIIRGSRNIRDHFRAYQPVSGKHSVAKKTALSRT